MIKTDHYFPSSPPAFKAFAPDEHHSSMQPNDWSCDEPPRGMPCKQSPVCMLRQEPVFGLAGETTLHSQFQRDQAGRTMGGQTEICRRLYDGAFSPWPT
jgi:hypothetical protein